MATKDAYVLGHSEAELKRLATQARLIDPITRRFLVSAGIREGMRVLDVGSGVGDVAILLAGLVGQRGEPNGFLATTQQCEGRRQPRPDVAP